MKILYVVPVIITIAFAASFYFYAYAPDRVISHWNIQGYPDGYMSKNFGFFFIPLLSTVLYILFTTLPKIDPLKSNIAKFRNYYDSFIVVIIGFLLYVHFIVISWALGIRVPIIQFITPAFVALLYYVGVLLQHTKRNWFIGIRTPWTLSSDEVWDRTHNLGGKLFKGSAIISLAGIILTEHSFFLLIVPIALSSIYLIYYSYAEYSRLAKTGRKRT